MSNTINFIDSVVRAIKPSGKRKIYWCNGCPGFGLRVTENGSKSFVFKYMSDRKSRWITIGKYPALTIRQARQEYDQMYDQVHEFGRDIVQEKIEKQKSEKKRVKVSEFVPIYLEKERLKGKSKIDEEVRCFNRDLIPTIGDLYIDDVTATHIEDIEKRILTRAAKHKSAFRGGRVAVKNYMAYIRQFFKYAVTRKLISSNPVLEIETLGSSEPRERVLSFEEIWLFWTRIDQIGVTPVISNALKFMLVTMQRGKEVRHMKYVAFKPSEDVWQMERGDTKNRKSIHRVPLCHTAQKIINEVAKYTGASPYVFGSTRCMSPPAELREDLTHLGETALSHALREKLQALEIEDFRPHDLRRSAATWITAVGLPEHYAQLMLNHSSGARTVTNQVYVQYAYDFEKMRAVNIWEFVLHEIILSKHIDEIPTLQEMRKKVLESGLLYSDSPKIQN